MPCLIKDVDPTNVAYTWEPEYLGECRGLEEIARIETNHKCGYYGFFKPSIDEVIRQIPDNLVERVTHFEIPQDCEVACYSYGDGHRATTILYRQR